MLKRIKQSFLNNNENINSDPEPVIPENDEPAPGNQIDRNDIAEMALDVVDKLLELTGVTISAIQRRDLNTENALEELPISFDIRGDDLGILIGRRGQTLASLQYIVRLILAHKLQSQVPVMLDIQGYKRRRYESLRLLAEHVGEQVRATKAPFTLEPMPPDERRIVHLTIAEQDDLISESTGERDDRKVVIMPTN